jgi:hypothetical protein
MGQSTAKDFPLGKFPWKHHVDHKFQELEGMGPSMQTSVWCHQATVNSQHSFRCMQVTALYCHQNVQLQTDLG